MIITFHGVRGSSPAVGPRFGAGGHTSCISVAKPGCSPALILDAGTGIQDVSDMLHGAPFEGAVLLTHLHWDHFMGLPFFKAADRDDATTWVLLPEQGDAEQVLRTAMSPPFFPITPGDLRGSWTFDGLNPGVHHIEGFELLAVDVEHKGGRTYGFRVTFAGRTFAYLPDALDDNDVAFDNLAAGADVLVRGAPFTAQQQQLADEYGHGTVEHAISSARRCGVKRLVITHHSPERSDAELESLAQHHGVEFAREGMSIDLSSLA